LNNYVISVALALPGKRGKGYFLVLMRLPGWLKKDWPPAS